MDSLTPDEEVGLKIENHSEYPSMASIYSLTFCVKVYLSELIAAEDGDEDCAEQERYICSLKYAWSNILCLDDKFEIYCLFLVLIVHHCIVGLMVDCLQNLEWKH